MEEEFERRIRLKYGLENDNLKMLYQSVLVARFFLKIFKDGDALLSIKLTYLIFFLKILEVKSCHYVAVRLVRLILQVNIWVIQLKIIKKTILIKQLLMGNKFFIKPCLIEILVYGN